MRSYNYLIHLCHFFFHLASRATVAIVAIFCENLLVGASPKPGMTSGQIGPKSRRIVHTVEVVIIEDVPVLSHALGWSCPLRRPHTAR